MSTLGTMSIERARKIVAACVAHCGFPQWGREGEERPSLPDVTLEEMLIANRVLDEQPTKERDNGDGSKSFTIHVRCDPRVVAAAYALQQYGGDPIELLAALGYRANPVEDDA